MTPVMPWRYYRDPLDIVLADEEKGCAACEFKAIAFNAFYCERGRCFGKRCSEYREVVDGQS